MLINFVLLVLSLSSPVIFNGEEMEIFETALNPNHLRINTRIIPTRINDVKIANVMSELNSLILTYGDVESKNAEFLEKIQPIDAYGYKKITDAPKLVEMRKLVHPIFRTGSYRSQYDPEANGWMELVQLYGFRDKKMETVEKAYLLRYGVTEKESEVVKFWTDYSEVSPDLAKLLQKFPAHKGIVIRNSRLDESSIVALEKGMVSGEPVSMHQFVKSGNENSGNDITVMATTSAGERQFEDFITPRPQTIKARLVIYSRTGRNISPLSVHGLESEILFHSKIAKGFRILGGSKAVEEGEPLQVYYVEEIK